MATVGNKGSIVTVGNNMRIERGPALVTAAATPELLSDDLTASHYAVGKQDAKGEFIEEGKDFSFLNYGGTNHEGVYGYYVYKRRDLSEADQKALNTDYTYIYDEIGFKPTEEAAITFAQKHAKD